MFACELTAMRDVEISEVLTALRYRYQRDDWKIDDAELVRVIREEPIRRGYPETRVDLVCTFVPNGYVSDAEA